MRLLGQQQLQESGSLPAMAIYESQPRLMINLAGPESVGVNTGVVCYINWCECFKCARGEFPRRNISDHVL